MARAGFAPEQTKEGGSSFRFPAGKGEIVNAEVGVDKAGGPDLKAGIFVTLQPLDKDWNATEADPVTEFLSFGKTHVVVGDEEIELFHPGNAKNNEDEDPEDLGREEGTMGNALWTRDETVMVDKKSKSAIFGASLVAHGFPVDRLNGYMPNLIGIKAEWYQAPQEKGDNYTGKRDPTCLSVKDKLVFDKGGKKTVGKTTTSAATAAAKTGKTATAAGKTAAGKTAPGADADATDAVGTLAETLLLELKKKFSNADDNVSVDRSRLNSQLVMLFPKHKVTPAQQKPVQTLFKSDEWITTMAEKHEFGVDETSVVFPQIAA